VYPGQHVAFRTKDGSPGTKEKAPKTPGGTVWYGGGTPHSVLDEAQSDGAV